MGEFRSNFLACSSLGGLTACFYMILKCLQNQAKILEKELKDVRKSFLKSERTVKERDVTIEELLRRLAALEKPPEPEPEPEPAAPESAPAAEEEPSDEEKQKLLDQMHDLQIMLTDKSRALTRAELKLAMLDLEKQMSGIRQAVTPVAAEAECAGGCYSHKAALAENDEMRAELQCVQEEITRRDEQIEFLMQVHDATADVEWAEDWNCNQCTLRNAPSEKQCTACGAMRDSATPTRDNTCTSPWQCAACTFENSGRGPCEACGSPKDLQSIWKLQQASRPTSVFK